jgi:hypothetical protein
MAISVVVILGDGTREMSPISDSMILSEAIAYRRGLAELYDQWLVKRSINIQAPFDPEISEGQVHEIDNPRENIVCTAVVRSMTLTITPEDRQTRISFETARRFE